MNTPVRATGDGRVLKARPQRADGKGLGLRVIIDHGRGNTSNSGHLNSVAVKEGQRVRRGQVIGHSGNSGESTAPHVHYEERYKGRPHTPTYNPRDYRPRPRQPRRD
jgi:murein DD-endopeptidase MepM/ murein hydrolase activator NlpD